MRGPQDDPGTDVHEYFWPHVLVEVSGPFGELGDQEFSGTKLGLMTCRECGAAVMLYPTVNALQLHLEWHHEQRGEDAWEAAPPESERRRLQALRVIAEAQAVEAGSEPLEDLKLAVNLINDLDELEVGSTSAFDEIFGELLALRDKYAHLLEMHAE